MNPPSNSVPKTESPNPTNRFSGQAGQAVPLIDHSQLAFRLDLTRKRVGAFPLDSMDFIMMDLERPDTDSRHAHWCAEDLTGRLLEFLACAEGIDGKTDARLETLMKRILRQKRSSGLFGRYAGHPVPAQPEDDPQSGCGRLISGFIRYFELTGDCRSLDAAIGIANNIIRTKDSWSKIIKSCSTNPIATWITEPFARLYGLTRDNRFLEHCGFVTEHLKGLPYAHAHGFLSTLRGLQLMALCTGDATWNEKPEYYRKQMFTEHYARPDGCVSEVLPHGFRNEGCAIADWLMLNLNAAQLAVDPEPYEAAENILWNAFFFNQLISGGFGHRDLLPYGYGMTGLAEAWWCCTEHCGMALTEVARHVVTYRDRCLSINFLVPGRFMVSRTGKPDVATTISTLYPAAADTYIRMTGLQSDDTVNLRIPPCIKHSQLSKEQRPDAVYMKLTGNIGHTIEPCHNGVMLKYGPLVLSPSVYYWNTGRQAIDSSVPQGYIPTSLPAGSPRIVRPEIGADEFVKLQSAPLPAWSYFEEGPSARLAVKDAAVNVPLRFDNGETHTLRFWPLCYNTSNLSCYDTPIIWPGLA